MQQQNIEQRFLAAMQESYRMVKLHGTRSNRKTRVLHGWVQDEMRQGLREDAYTSRGNLRPVRTKATLAVCIMVKTSMSWWPGTNRNLA